MMDSYAEEVRGNEALFLFPRTKDGKEMISLEEEEMRFITTLSPKTEINRKFRLKDMVVNDKLEI